jgi:hypothetical protein
MWNFHLVSKIVTVVNRCVTIFVDRIQMYNERDIVRITLHVYLWLAVAFSVALGSNRSDPGPSKAHLVSH